MRRSSALIIFAKEPVPGRVKTRLSPRLSAAESAGLYDCMLKDTLTGLNLLPDIEPVIFFQDDPDSSRYFQKLFPDLESIPQQGSTLGERMENAFTLMFSRHYTKVAIIGSDAPDLPVDYILQAFSLLENEVTDGVLGPAEDGGYYLVGLKKVCPELFASIPWSTSDVLEESMKRARAASLSMKLLPEWHDLDTYADLGRLELRDSSHRAILTRKFIAKVSAGRQNPF